jgi:hypothetical protein
MNPRRTFLKLAAAGAVVSTAANAAEGSVKDILGAWLTYHSSPYGPFKELLTFAEGGALTETNALLHNSSNLELIPGIVMNASDGMGTWTRTAPRKVRVEFRKLLFGREQGYFGDFWVKGDLAVKGSNLEANWSQIWIVDKNDNLLVDLIAMFGPATSTGKPIG